MLLPFYWSKCNPETSCFLALFLTFFSYPTYFLFLFFDLVMNSVTTCKNKRLGNIPIKDF